LSGSIGVAFPGFIGAGAALAAGVAGASAGLEQTGGSVVTSLDVALTDLELSLQAALSASLGVGAAA
jgi:hypothetical protein